MADDLDLPISRVKFSGPAVDALENRKESDNAPRLTADDLRANFEKFRARARQPATFEPRPLVRVSGEQVVW